MSSWLDRLGRRAVRHRWWFIATWVLVAALAGAFAIGLDGTTIDTFAIPGAQSQTALDVLNEKFPSQAGSSATVVFATTNGIDDPAVEPAIQESITALGEMTDVTSVTDPYGPAARDRRVEPGRPQGQGRDGHGAVLRSPCRSSRPTSTTR